MISLTFVIGIAMTVVVAITVIEKPKRDCKQNKKGKTTFACESWSPVFYCMAKI